MIEKGALGGWLQGPGSTPSSFGRAASGGYPGQGLGRPADGPGSVAGFGRRAAGLAIDWAIALLIANGLMRPLGWGALAPLVALLAMNLLLVGTAGFTIGHRLVGVRVERLDSQVTGRLNGPGQPGPVRALVRAVLLCLAVPPLLMDGDRRGLHDRLSGTVCVLRA
jgi:uncharacterized RDD family membrane protein YckC